MGLIFDLDQTIIDTSIAEPYRKGRSWGTVYTLIKNFKVYNGIIEAMHQFRKDGHEICIVTSSISIYCDKVLKCWDIPHDHQVCFHDTPNRKPHPEPIIRALSLLKKKPNEVLSFGDRDIDIVASNKANVTSVECMWGCSDSSSLIKANPTYTINDSQELLVLVNNFRR